ncbi:MAG: beta-galactosidase, partial [Enterococcus casseliflavus]|nr:beta-galactosidase [Enterococcus casseliflavus]
QSYGSWEEIFLPEAMPTFKNPAQQLDYRRFLSDMNLELYQLEKAAIAKYSQGIPYMTNLMGLHKYVDGFKWAPEMDVVSWNSYPNPFEKIPYPQFLANDLTRSLKKKPFLIMEQATSAVNWRQINGAKTPNQLRLWSYEALAHGADGIMFFQWRQSRGGAEKFHSAMVPHGDPHSSRIFRECAQLGNEFSQLSEIVGTRFLADVAVVFDWENWWALELDAKPSTLKYIHQLRSLYAALRALNLSVDFVHPSESLDGYPLVIAPNLYSAPEAFGKKINDYVRQGGIFLTNFFSGIVNEYDQVYLGGYPGLFRDTLGIIVEEFYPMKVATHHQIDFQGRRYDNSLWEEVIHLNGAESLATFQFGYLSDKPAITMNQIDDGYAYYVGTELSLEGLTTFLATILENHKLATHAQHFLAAPTEVSVTCRKGAGYTLVFFLNHTEQTTKVKLKAPGADLLTKETRQLVVLKPKEVAVLKYVD